MSVSHFDFDLNDITRMESVAMREANDATVGRRRVANGASALCRYWCVLEVIIIINW